MMLGSTVDILLATYNGAAYLKLLLESILDQNYTNWRLICRDDGSTDGTTGILESYVEMYADNMSIISDSERNMGASKSFSRLLEYSTSDYIMFCDQDDVWDTDKIEVTLNKMMQTESDNPLVPVLVHTDLRVVDASLSLIDPSFWSYQRLNPSRSTLGRLVVQNHVTGCTVMINSKLKSLSGGIPAQAIMHDWWLALVAASVGVIAFVNRPTIFYRQHGGNDTGAKRYSLRYFSRRVFNLRESIQSNERIFKQAAKFYECYFYRLSDSQKQLIRAFVGMYDSPRISRIFGLVKFDIHKNGIIRNLGYCAVLCMTPRNHERKSQRSTLSL